MPTTLDDLINGLIGTPTPIPQDEPIQRFSGFNIEQAPMPKPLTDFEKQQLRTAITSGGLTDLAGIFLGHAPEGRSNAALQTFAGAPRAIDEEARKTAAFNAQQENQFGRGAQQQQAALQRMILQEQGRNVRADESNLIKGQGLELADMRTQLAHQDRMRQLEVAQQNANTAEERARIQEELGKTRNEIARMQAETAKNRLTGKPLDPATRNLLNDAKVGSDFAKEALSYFEATGGNAGGVIAGRMPTALLPDTTNKFNTLRVKAEAQLRKYMAGSAVTPTEMIALQPLLVDLSGTPTQIRASLRGIKDFFDKKRESLLGSLESTGIRSDIAEQVREQYGEKKATPTTPGIRVPSPQPGVVESNTDKIKRARANAGID